MFRNNGTSKVVAKDYNSTKEVTELWKLEKGDKGDQK